MAKWFGGFSLSTALFSVSWTLAPASASPPEARLIPWALIVLDENGNLNRIEASGRSVPLHFRDPLYEGDRIEVSAGRGKLAIRN